MKKIGFVIPWYYKDIPGGAEQELRGIVKHLHEKNVHANVYEVIQDYLNLLTGLTDFLT